MTLLHGDCLEVMRGMEADSIDLIAVDPPYFKVKGDAWDRQWDKPDAFLAWIGQLCEQWQRLLKPNGSLYCFASPRMAARVECKIAERFGVLNRIRWVKSAGWHQKAEKETLRSFLSPWEEIIFAEHYGADNMAKGEAGYAAKCDELRGFVFEPLRAYLDGERDRAGVSVRQVAEAFQRKTGSRTVTGMAGHWFGRIQWALPTRDNYEWLRATLANLNHNGEYLRRDYEELRRDYEELRRPFAVSADVPYTDVWDFPTVSHRPGKHPCEKPLAMMEHIIRSSSREGATVLDCCMGGGTTGEACANLNRRFIGIEKDDGWYAAARRRLLERQELLVV
jgi:adenine-specific DNA-methyltransferase